MIEFLKLFSNREISIIVWLLLIFIILTTNSKGSFGKFLLVLKALFAKKIILFYIGIGIYLAFIVTTLNKLGVWEFSLYKDFVYWILTTGMVLFFSVSDLNTYKDFSKIVLTATSLTIILEFIIGFYNFSLIWEIILIPTLTFISILAYYAEMKKEDRNSILVANFLKNVLAVLGFGFLIYGIYQLISNYNEFFTLSNLKSFLLPPLFTILFLPFIYYVVLYVKYERVFGNLRRYKFLSDKRKRKIRLAILRYANIGLYRIESANKIVLFNKKELQDETDIKTFLRKHI